MDLVRDNNRLVIHISSSATILDVEDDFLKINDELVNGNLEIVEFNIEQVEDIDTAYLQFILSIINTLKKSKVEIVGDSYSLSEILELYGIDLGGMINDEVYSYSG